MIKFKQGWRRNFLSPHIITPDLEGERVILRPPCLKDYPVWSEVRNKNQQFLKPYEPEWASDCLTKDFFMRRLVRQEKEVDAGRGVFFLIHENADKKIIGGINLNNIQLGAARHATLGYWLDEKYKRRGYMYESASLAIDYAFDVLKLHRLNAACVFDNEASVGLLEKLSFEEEGFAKSYFQINGQWCDHRLFGLLCSSRK